MDIVTSFYQTHQSGESILFTKGKEVDEEQEVKRGLCTLNETSGVGNKSSPNT